MKNSLKKILFYTRPLVPPWDEGSKNLAFEIAKNNDGNFIFELLSDKSNLLKKESWPKKKREIQINKIFPSARLNIWSKFALLKRLFLSPLDVNLIHFLFTPRLITSQLFHWKLKNKSIKTLQTIATLDPQISRDKILAKKILFADLIIAQSQFTLNQLKKLEIPAQLIYPGIDLKKFVPQTKNSSLMKKLGITPNDFVVLFAGEYDRLEAVDDILDAFKILKTKKETGVLKMILACRLKTEKDREIKKSVQKRVLQNGWKNNFIFLDFAQDMVALYNLADLNIFPVRKMVGKFDVPLVLIESMACGKTVLVSNLPVLTEIIQDVRNGGAVPVGNSQLLAEKILWLKDNPQINQQLGLAGREFVHQHFNIQQIAEKYQQVYQDLLK